MLTGTNLVYTKKYNLRIVHEVIRLFGPISRADIARRTELTGQTIWNLVRELLARGLVKEGRRTTGGRGAPSTAIMLNPNGAYAVGLDLDRDHLTGILVDLAGTVRQRVHLDVDTPSPTETVDLMADMVTTLVDREGLRHDQVAGIGVGVPGPMHKASDGSGYLVRPKAFAGWDNIPLASMLSERVGVSVHLENNALAAAIGEHWYGAGRHLQNFFYIYVGSGLGGGLIMDGMPQEGFTGNAGEIGYLPTVLAGGGAVDNSGDVEHVGLHFNLPRLYEALRRSGTNAQKLEDLDALLASGHGPLLEWMDNASDHLTGLVLAVEYLIDPEAICFGGRLSDSILRGLMERVAAQLPSRRAGGKITSPTHFLATAGVDAAALGVATLPIYEIFAPTARVLLKKVRDSNSLIGTGKWRGVSSL